VLDAQSFAGLLAQNNIVFFGSGSAKSRELLQHANASFVDISYSARHLAYLAQAGFEAGKFTDFAYAEPAYLKEFYTHTPK
jgi:tRNA threonylcarbamoyladenosine biosynthesis protein TsaB